MRQRRKGAGEAVRKHVEALGGSFPADVQMAADDVSRKGSTPLVVADGARVLGVVELKDIVKGGIKEKFADLRAMGIKTVIDLNAVPPAGIEGVDASDRKTPRDGILAWGALGVGRTKMKIHKKAIQELFAANDKIFDAEQVLELGRSL